MARKRYTTREARMLLTRVVGFVEGTSRRGHPLNELVSAHVGDVVVVGSAPAAVRDASVEQIAQWRDRIRGLLRLLVGVRDHAPGVLPQVQLRQVTMSTSAADLRDEIDGPAGQVLAYQTVALVRAIGRQYLRQCAAPFAGDPPRVCGRVFVREGRQEYCSGRCQKRVYMQQWYHREKGVRHGQAKK